MNEKKINNSDNAENNIDHKIAIKVENLTKIYPIYDQKQNRMKEALSLTRKKYHHDFYALNDVSFEVKKGETVGIIGQNGCGKSTLLKILSGILTPTSGKVTVNGKISALLELGAGFNPEMSGMENIYLNGTIMGYTKDEMEQKVPAIVEFADIGEFIHQPVKMYSSGMFVRLAFAVAINVEPDILIVDEALAVGDMRFQQKCFREIEKFKERGTILMVSHDMSAINKFCDKGIFMNAGSICFYGEATLAVKKYQSFIMDQFDSKAEEVQGRKKIETAPDQLKLDLPPITPGLEKAGDGKAAITHCGLFDSEGNYTEVVEPEETYILAMRVEYYEEIKDTIVGMTVKNRLGINIFGANSDWLNLNTDTIDRNKEFRFCFKIPNLIRNEFTITIAIASGITSNHIQHCYIHDAVKFNIIKPPRCEDGILAGDFVKITAI